MRELERRLSPVVGAACPVAVVVVEAIRPREPGREPGRDEGGAGVGGADGVGAVDSAAAGVAVAAEVVASSAAATSPAAEAAAAVAASAPAAVVAAEEAAASEAARSSASFGGVEPSAIATDLMAVAARLFTMLDLFTLVVVDSVGAAEAVAAGFAPSSWRPERSTNRLWEGAGVGSAAAVVKFLRKDLAPLLVALSTIFLALPANGGVEEAPKAYRMRSTIAGWCFLLKVQPVVAPQ